MRDDEQPFVSQLRGDRAEQHLTQRGGSRAVRGVGLPHARAPLGGGLTGRALIARGQQLIDALGGGFDLGAPGQFKTLERRRRHRPQETALRAERVFEQQRVAVEQLLNLRRLERLRLGERGVAGAGRAELRFELLMLLEERRDLALQRGDLRGREFVAGQVQALRGGVEALLDGAGARDKLRVGALPNLGSGFGQQFQQAARARLLAGLQGLRGKAFRWAALVQLHQQVKVKLVVSAHGGKVSGAQFLADEVGAHLLNRAQCFFDLRARLVQQATFTRHAGEVIERIRRAFTITDCAAQRQRLVIRIERRSASARREMERAQLGERGGLPAPVADVAAQRQRLIEVIECARAFAHCRCGLAHAVERDALPIPVANRAPALQRLVVIRQRCRALTVCGRHVAEVMQCAPLSGVGVALPELQGLQKSFARFLRLAERSVKRAQPREFEGLSEGLARRLIGAERLLIVIERLLPCAHRVADHPEIVERPGFPRAMPERAPELQRLLKGSARLLILAQILVGLAQGVEQRGFPIAIRRDLPQPQGLLTIIKRLLIFTEFGIVDGDFQQHSGFFALIAERAPELQRLVEFRNGAES